MVNTTITNHALYPLSYGGLSQKNKKWWERMVLPKTPKVRVLDFNTPVGRASK